MMQDKLVEGNRKDLEGGAGIEKVSAATRPSHAPLVFQGLACILIGQQYCRGSRDIQS